MLNPNLAGACLDEEETLIPKLLGASRGKGDVRYTKEMRSVDARVDVGVETVLARRGSGHEEEEAVVEFDVEETPMTSDLAKAR